MNTLFICFMARSGSTWLGKVFHSHPKVSFHCHWLENRSGEMTPAQIAGFERRIQKLGRDRSHAYDVEPYFPQPENPELMVLKDSYASQRPRLCADHGQVILLARDPRAQYNSLKNHSTFGGRYRPRPSAERWAALIDTYIVLAQNDPNRFRLVRYEDLCANPLSELPKLFEFAGLNFAPEVEKFVIESHASHELGANQVIKDPKITVNQWRYELTPAEKSVIEQTVAGTDAGRLYQIEAYP